MPSFPVIDLHCDLLSYLALDNSRSIHDSQVPCAFPHLLSGNVKVQVMAIYTETNSSSTLFGEKQVSKYKELTSQFFPQIQDLRQTVSDASLYVLPAYENASSFSKENESLKHSFERFNQWTQIIGKPLYVSFTWKTENRFGGGNLSDVGLKGDGIELLRFLEPFSTAIDLSHASDPLAYDILNAIDRYQLQLTPIASHSNFRDVTPNGRNLPNEIAIEIAKRGGLIGLNFVNHIMGKSMNCIQAHISHAQKIGVADALCFGADFFYEEDLEEREAGFFYKEFDTSACYPKVLKLLTHFDEHIQKTISYESAQKWLKEHTDLKKLVT